MANAYATFAARRPARRRRHVDHGGRRPERRRALRAAADAGARVRPGRRGRRRPTRCRRSSPTAPGRRRRRSAGRPPARPARPTTTSRPGSSATRRSWPPRCCSARTARTASRCRCRASAACRPSPAARSRRAIWTAFMTGALEGQPVEEFAAPGEPADGRPRRPDRRRPSRDASPSPTSTPTPADVDRRRPTDEPDARRRRHADRRRRRRHRAVGRRTEPSPGRDSLWLRRRPSSADARPVRAIDGRSPVRAHRPPIVLPDARRPGRRRPRAAASAAASGSVAARCGTGWWTPLRVARRRWPRWPAPSATSSELPCRAEDWSRRPSATRTCATPTSPSSTRVRGFADGRSPYVQTDAGRAARSSTRCSPAPSCRSRRWLTGDRRPASRPRLRRRSSTSTRAARSSAFAGRGGRDRAAPCGRRPWDAAMVALAPACRSPRPSTGTCSPSRSPPARCWAWARSQPGWPRASCSGSPSRRSSTRCSCSGRCSCCACAPGSWRAFGRLAGRRGRAWLVVEPAGHAGHLDGWACVLHVQPRPRRRTSARSGSP